MANKNVTCAAGEWTLLTDEDVTAIRVQNLSPQAVLLMATATASAPSDSAGAVVLSAGNILLPDTDLASLFPGVSGAARVYAFVNYTTATLSVSYA